MRNRGYFRIPECKLLTTVRLKLERRGLSGDAGRRHSRAGEAEHPKWICSASQSGVQKGSAGPAVRWRPVRRVEVLGSKRSVQNSASCGVSQTSGEPDAKKPLLRCLPCFFPRAGHDMHCTKGGQTLYCLISVHANFSALRIYLTSNTGGVRSKAPSCPKLLRKNTTLHICNASHFHIACTGARCRMRNC